MDDAGTNPPAAATFLYGPLQPHCYTGQNIDKDNPSVSTYNQRVLPAMVERMEKDGIVGAPNGSKPREVLANAI